MFDTVITRCVRPKKVEWESPKFLKIDLGDADGVQSYKLLKGAENFLYKKLDIKSGTSNDLYKKSEQLWRNLIDLRLAACKDVMDERKSFYLEKDTVVYLINGNKEIVDIENFADEEAVEAFEDAHQEFVLELTTFRNTTKFFKDGKDGLTKLILYRAGTQIEKEDYTPVIILELNTNKSVYRIYHGILIYEDFIYIPSISKDLETNNFIDLIRYFDIDYYLNYSDEQALGIYENYQEFKKSPVEISVRELTTLLNRVGYKLEIDEEDKLMPVKGLEDVVNNKKIQDFYNTFDSSAFTILHLSELRKTFKYNKITLLDVMCILSKEYIAEEGNNKVTAEILADIVYKLQDSAGADKCQVETLKDEVK